MGSPPLRVNRHLVLPLDMQMKKLVMESCDEVFFFSNKREEGLPVRRLLVMVEQAVHS